MPDRPTGLLARAHEGNRIAGALAAAAFASVPVAFVVFDRYSSLFTLPFTVRGALLFWLGCVAVGFLFPRLPVRVVRILELVSSLKP